MGEEMPQVEAYSDGEEHQDDVETYHYVREAIASGNYAYVWIHGKLNPADILSKHWAWKDVWPFLQPLLYWQGDTNDCPIRLMSGIEA